MELSNTIVISRRLEIQDIARQMSKNIFVADTISEAIELTNQISPEIILIYHWVD